MGADDAELFLDHPMLRAPCHTKRLRELASREAERRVISARRLFDEGKYEEWVLAHRPSRRYAPLHCVLNSVGPRNFVPVLSHVWRHSDPIHANWQKLVKDVVGSVGIQDFRKLMMTGSELAILDTLIRRSTVILTYAPAAVTYLSQAPFRHLDRISWTGESEAHRRALLNKAPVMWATIRPDDVWALMNRDGYVEFLFDTPRETGWGTYGGAGRGTDR